MSLGDWITAENYRSQTARYRVIDIQIIDTREAQIPIYGSDFLTLVTCFPFNEVVAGGPMRFLVLAEKEVKPSSQNLSDRAKS
jgi:sortase A